MDVDDKSFTYHTLITSNLPRRRSARLVSVAASAHTESVEEINLPIKRARKRRKINEKTQSVHNTPPIVDGATAIPMNTSVDIQDLDAKPHNATSSTKPRRRRAPKTKPVYIIPDVKKKETTFSGRLGRLCLIASNILMIVTSRLCMHQYYSAK